MKEKGSILLVTVIIPVVLTILLPISKVATHAYFRREIYRGFYGGYLLVDVLTAVIFALCICYLFWFLQSTAIRNKRNIMAAAFVTNLLLILVAICVRLLTGNPYILLCMIEHKLIVITSGIVSFYLWRCTPG